MKSYWQLGAVVFTLMLGLSCGETAVAQDQSAAGQQSGPLSSLSAQDKMKFLKARKEVLANNPDLKAEQESLTKERAAIKNEGDNATQDERTVLFQNTMAHEKKMKAAMLQVDPSLGPVFDQIDQQMKQKFQQRAAQNGGI